MLRCFFPFFSFLFLFFGDVRMEIMGRGIAAGDLKLDLTTDTFQGFLFYGGNGEKVTRFLWFFFFYDTSWRKPQLAEETVL